MAGAGVAVTGTTAIDSMVLMIWRLRWAVTARIVRWSCCTVGYTMDVMYFAWLPNAVEIDKAIQLPQFRLRRTVKYDCSQNYTGGASTTSIWQCDRLQAGWQWSVGREQDCETGGGVKIKRIEVCRLHRMHEMQTICYRCARCLSVSLSVTLVFKSLWPLVRFKKGLKSPIFNKVISNLRCHLWLSLELSLV